MHLVKHSQRELHPATSAVLSRDFEDLSVMPLAVGYGELTRRAANARANLQRRQGAESSPPRGTRESGAA